MSLSTICSIVSFYIFKLNSESFIIFTNWINSGSFSVDWAIQLNLLSASMILMVNFVSTLIHIYSVGYMKKRSKNLCIYGLFRSFYFFVTFSIFK